MKSIIPKVGCVGLLCLVAMYGQAQVSHSLSLTMPMSKDGLTNGLLFWGGGLTYGFSVQKQQENHVSLYEAKIGLQAIQRKGLLGVNLMLQPLSYFYGFSVSSSTERMVFVGPKVSAGYQLQVYPDLTQGHVLWMSNLSLAPQLIVQQRVGENRLVIKLSSSVVSATSRPQTVEPYYFSLKFTDLLRNLHSNPQIGSLNLFRQTDFSADYIIQGTGRNWSVGYDFKYINYTNTPTFKALTHSIALKFYRK